MTNKERCTIRAIVQSINSINVSVMILLTTIIALSNVLTDTHTHTYTHILISMSMLLMIDVFKNKRRGKLIYHLHFTRNKYKNYLCFFVPHPLLSARSQTSKILGSWKREKKKQNTKSHVMFALCCK